MPIRTRRPRPPRSPLACTLAALFFAATAATAAFAGDGWIVEQRVEVKRDGQDASQMHTWSIDGDKLRLEVVARGTTTTYVFNGKTLYVCGKGDDALFKFLDAQRVDISKLRQRLKNGICYEAPSNFLARFTLSPVVAMESVDRTDGLRLTISLKDLTVGAGGSDDKVAGHACNGVKRTYTLTKKSEGSMTKTNATERLCAAGDLRWRAALWSEAQKTVLRTPGGGAFLKELRRDHEAWTGLPLKSVLEETVTGDDGAAHKTKLTLDTRSIKKAAMSAALFRMPEGYELFDPTMLELQVAAAGKPKPGEAPAEPEDVLDAMTSVLFCSIAGAVGCLVH
jgi:hypothetical protein